VLSDGAERVLSEMLFHANVAEAVKARPLIVARQTLAMTTSVVKHQYLYLPYKKPLLYVTASYFGFTCTY